SPGYTLSLRIVLNQSDEILRLVDRERIGLRRDADDDGWWGNGYSDGGGRGLRGIGDGSCGGSDGSAGAHLRGRGVGDGGAGWTAAAGEGSARVGVAIGAGNSPGYTLSLRIVLNESDEILRLINSERLGLRRDADGNGRRRNGYGDGGGHGFRGIGDG